MSLISDALKKLEHQPKRHPDHLPHGGAGRDGAKGSPRKMLIISVCLLIIAASAVYLYAKLAGKKYTESKDIPVSVVVEDVDTKDDISEAIDSPPADPVDVIRGKEVPGRVDSVPGRDRSKNITAFPAPVKNENITSVSREKEGKAPRGPGAGVKGAEKNAAAGGDQVVKKEVPLPQKERKLFISKSTAEKRQERELRYFNEGVRNLEEGDLSRAGRNFVFALENNPENVDALCNLSVVSIKLGDYDSAYLYVREALRISPTHVGSLINAGVLYLNTEQYRQALDEFNRALIYDKDNPDVLANIALLYHKIGDAEKALHYGRKAASISPENSEAWYNLGLVYYGKKSLYQAGDAFSRFLALADEDDPRVPPVKDILEALK